LVPQVEQVLVGKPLTREVLHAAAVAARAAVKPIDDVRASADYRRLVAGNLLLRLLEKP
jgi:CO/xanthine dehydrogenase FAD-binding subunit